MREREEGEEIQTLLQSGGLKCNLVMGIVSTSALGTTTHEDT